MSVLIVDYKMGNLGSVSRALEECGCDVSLSDNPSDLKNAERFILPGVGAFADGMNQLKRQGWIPEIRAAVSDGIPMLGICLGMQLLAEAGTEGGETQGLDLIPGKVTRLIPPAQQTRLPHVGWNEIHFNHNSSILEGVPSGTDFYFVHSYHFIPADPGVVMARTPYCGEFASVVMKNRILGVQFHPEKSGKPGFQILRNFLKI
ncbi:MAG: imidazole glycerol phosphate synthase subunit HisH [Candidatus Omnitrophica bacterium]|nr:imidazole glycerol phosphate synthase subunit HisH [Candidatus Omnitrophota bacterium]